MSTKSCNRFNGPLQLHVNASIAKVERRNEGMIDKIQRLTET